MSPKEKLILEWAKRVLRFASNADAELFAANGALFMETSPPNSTATVSIVAEDESGGVVFLNITNVTGTLTFQTFTPWLTGTVAETGMAAAMTALSAPPRTRYGRPLVRVRSTEYRTYRRRNGWVYLDLRADSTDVAGRVASEAVRI